MKALTIITLLATLCMSQTTDTISNTPLGLDLQKGKITIGDLWVNLGAPDSLGKLGTTNMIYYKGDVICYLLIDEVYSIEIRDGSLEALNIGMKRKEITKILGKVQSDTLPSREILEYSYTEKNINHIMNLEIKDKKLTKIYIRKI